MSKIKEANVAHADKSPLKVGLVQTAYANGSSTHFVKDCLVYLSDLESSCGIYTYWG